MGRVANSGRHQVKSAQMEEDRAAEPLTVPEAAGHGLDLLDAGVEGFADGVGGGSHDRIEDSPEVRQGSCPATPQVHHTLRLLPDRT